LEYANKGRRVRENILRRRGAKPGLDFGRKLVEAIHENPNGMTMNEAKRGKGGSARRSKVVFCGIRGGWMPHSHLNFKRKGGRTTEDQTTAKKKGGKGGTTPSRERHWCI